MSIMFDLFISCLAVNKVFRITTLHFMIIFFVGLIQFLIVYCSKILTFRHYNFLVQIRYLKYCLF